MSNVLKPLVWHDASNSDLYAEGANYHYDVAENKGSYFVRYLSKDFEASMKRATGFATIDEAKTWAWNHYNEKMQPYVKPDSITDIANWFKAAKPEPTISDLCVQIGCMLEEVCEFFQGLNFAPATYAQLSEVSELYKSKHPWALDRLDDISYDKRIEIVDACCDINVTSAGVMQLLGGVDVLGAQREVIRSNNSKMVKGKFEFDDNGKIQKPDSYSEPDLIPFISTMQNLHKGG